MSAARPVALTSVAAGLALAIGCGGSPKESAAPHAASADAARVFREAPAERADGKPAPPPPAAGDVKDKPPEPIERKIIYSGQLTVVVTQLDAAVGAIERLIEENKGYAARSEVQGVTGKARTATFVIRVPAENFRTLKTALAALGSPERNTTDSKDVTEEFVDVSSRVRNLKAEEESLLKLLREAHLRDEQRQLRDDIRKLRGEIEQAEGRLKYLGTLAALSTLEVTVKEGHDYKPPPVEEPPAPPEPAFADRVAAAFQGSVDAVTRVGKAVAVFAAGLAPWLPLLVPAVFVAYRVLRWLARVSGEPPKKCGPLKRPPVVPESPPEGNG